MLFVIDFDGTLTLQDSVDALLERFAEPEWRVVEQAWLDGEITAVECMRRQIRMVRADHMKLEAFFRGIPLDPGFLSFWQHVRRFAEVAIVSDGLDHGVELAMRNGALPRLPVFANRLRFVPDGLDISFPHLHPACAGGNGVCKCEVSRRLAAGSGGPIVLVGDGKSDHCLAGNADEVFAKGKLARHCARAGIAFQPFESFADVLARVRSWDPHPLAKEVRSA